MGDVRPWSRIAQLHPKQHRSLASVGHAISTNSGVRRRALEVWVAHKGCSGPVLALQSDASDAFWPFLTFSTYAYREFGEKTINASLASLTEKLVDKLQIGFYADF